VRNRPFRRGAKRQERVSGPVVRGSPSDPGVMPPPPESGPGHRHTPDGVPLTRTSLRASPSAVHNARLADEAFHRAQRALGLNDLPSATKHIAKALTFDPKNTSYQALQAFASVDRKASAEDVKRAIRTLDAMVVTEDDNSAAHYYLARLYKRDRLAQDLARKHFARAAELDPSNVHAAAEAKRKG
jgi:tetratricopeptide (TPR) repeat protein